MMLDGVTPVNISTYDRKVTLVRPGCGIDGRTCEFIALPNPFSSMWLLSRERLQHCITTPWWRCGSAEASDVTSMPHSPSPCMALFALCDDAVNMTP